MKLLVSRGIDDPEVVSCGGEKDDAMSVWRDES